MRVVRAEFMGFCFGVRDALTIARQTPEPNEVTIYGELVHNPTVQSELALRGFRVVSEDHRESSQIGERIMITAHGISQKRLDQLQSTSTEIIDTTCPLVRRVHEAAQTLAAENRLVIVIGRPNHVEVQGIVEDLDRCVVVESPDQIIDWKEKAIGVVTQSTTTPDMAQQCLTRILECNRIADVRFIDTVCRPTRQRQHALEALCSSVSLVVVVGGNHSNNTRQLAQRCVELGCKAIQIESATELRPEWFHGFDSVGLTAGTSTPDETISDVAEYLEGLNTTPASTKTIENQFQGRCRVAPGYVDVGLWPTVRFFANGDDQVSSVPDVLFIEFDAITVQEVAILFLERLGAVMFFLRGDIRHHVFSMGGTDRKYPVTTLPEKLVQVRAERFDEF